MVEVRNCNASSVDLMLHFWIREERYEDAIVWEYLEKAKKEKEAEEKQRKKERLEAEKRAKLVSSVTLGLTPEQIIDVDGIGVHGACEVSRRVTGRTQVLRPDPAAVRSIWAA